MADVILAVTVQDKEFTVCKMQGPRGPKLFLLCILAGVLRPAPFVQNLTIERGLEKLVKLKVGNIQHLAGALRNKREAVGPGKLRTPFANQPALFVIDDHVVLHVVR